MNTKKSYQKEIFQDYGGQKASNNIEQNMVQLDNSDSMTI